MDFDFHKRPELNLTPLIDVMLVLISILMITVPSVTYQEKISIPEGSAISPKKEHSLIEIRIDKYKNIYLKKDKYLFKNFADNFLLKTKSHNKKTLVYIRADKELKYSAVMRILKIVKQAGFLKVALITDG
jgi:biopolymer transport protein ExbD